jgi:hypothetical protein
MPSVLDPNKSDANLTYCKKNKRTFDEINRIFNGYTLNKAQKKDGSIDYKDPKFINAFKKDAVDH